MSHATTGTQKTSLRIAVAICSVGRPDQLFETVSWLTRQTTKPSQVVIVVTSPVDVPSRLAEIESLPLEIVFSCKGLTRQRNCALVVLTDKCDVIFFIDDDYLPERSALHRLDRAFRWMPEVSGITGRLLADGIQFGGIDVGAAKALIESAEREGLSDTELITDQHRRGLYGCNMAFRVSAIGNDKFDENLPLYGWQEDVDFSNRVDGKNILLDSLIGVHCGTPSGRETNGAALGYSQIANPIYLLRKGTLSSRHASRLVLGNMAANILRLWSFKAWENRPARLLGNIRAIGDVLLGRAHPRRIEKTTGI